MAEYNYFANAKKAAEQQYEEKMKKSKYRKMLEGTTDSLDDFKSKNVPIWEYDLVDSIVAELDKEKEYGEAFLEGLKQSIGIREE